MHISWFTVIAQLVNFLILVWLMKRYLYKPVLNAIDEREKKIAGQLADAETKKTEAAKEQGEFQQKNAQFDLSKKDLMDKAVAGANDERNKLLEIARNDANAIRTKQENSLKDMQVALNHEIAQKTQQEIFAISRKVLTDIASVSFEEQAVNLFLKQLGELKEEEKKKIIAVFQSAANPVLVQSAFDLSPKEQSDILNAVKTMSVTEPKIEFKTTPEIIGGIELTANGFKVAWSISDYLNSLEKSIAETIKDSAHPEKKTVTHPPPEVKANPEKTTAAATEQATTPQQAPENKPEPEKK